MSQLVSVCSHCHRQIDGQGNYVDGALPKGATLSHGACLACGTLWLMQDGGPTPPAEWIRGLATLALAQREIIERKGLVP